MSNIKCMKLWFHYNPTHKKWKISASTAVLHWKIMMDWNHKIGINKIIKKSNVGGGGMQRLRQLVLWHYPSPPLKEPRKKVGLSTSTKWFGVAGFFQLMPYWSNFKSFLWGTLRKILRANSSGCMLLPLAISLKTPILKEKKMDMCYFSTGTFKQGEKNRILGKIFKDEKLDSYLSN